MTLVTTLLVVLGLLQVDDTSARYSFPAQKGDVGGESGLVKPSSRPFSRSKLGAVFLHIEITDEGIFIRDDEGYPVPVPFKIDFPADSGPDVALVDDSSEESSSRRSRQRRYMYFPRKSRGLVLFQFPDDNFRNLFISGSFTGWDLRPMEFDEERETWTTRVDLARGTHHYVFVVEDTLRQRRKPDPSNPTRVRHDDQGWVSEIVIGKDGDVLAPFEEYDLRPIGSPALTYQRVDGVSLFIQPSFESRRSFYPSLFAKIGYGFAGKRWSLWGRFEQPVTAADEVVLTLEAYDRTYFTDQNGISTSENSLACLLSTWDYRDYYIRKGLAGGVELSLPLRIRIGAEYRHDNYESLEARVGKALRINGPGGFRENPAIDDGDLRSVVSDFRIGTKLNHLEISHEYAGGPTLGGDFYFHQLRGQARTRLRLGRRQYVDLRLEGGKNLDGEMPLQKRFRLGGLGTVRGYGFQSLVVLDPDRQAAEPAPYGGEIMGLINAEYVFAIARHFESVLFFDSGTTWESASMGARIEDFKSSLGIGFQTGDDELRLSLAKSLDDSGRNVIAYLRVNRMF